MTTRRPAPRSEQMRAARRKKRHREVIRNRIIFGISCALILILIIFIISRIVSAVVGRGSAADTSTLTFKDNGSVVFEEVADFDKDVYSDKELKRYTKQLITSFNEAAGDDSIVLDKFKIKKDKVYIKTTYSSADIYSTFTSYNVYMDKVENAYDAGYTFADATFSTVVDGNKLEATEANVIADYAGYYVAVVKENTTVVVPGDIVLVSSISTDVKSNNTVCISQADGNNDATDMVYIIFEKDEK